MKKLIEGIVEFRRNVQSGYRERFSRLAVGQDPDALFVACSDSRVVPNTFASTDPGELFVVRNVGNLVPCCGDHGVSSADESEAAAIEFSLLHLNVSDIIICGHSECGAMQALIAGREKVEAPHLQSWLQHGEGSLEKWRSGAVLDESLSEHNQLSQINVLAQMENIKTYKVVRERIAQGKLKVHGWWFDIKKADVYAYDDELGKFALLDEAQAKKLLQKLHESR